MSSSGRSLPPPTTSIACISSSMPDIKSCRACTTSPARSMPVKPGTRCSARAATSAAAPSITTRPSCTLRIAHSSLDELLSPARLEHHELAVALEHRPGAGKRLLANPRLRIVTHAFGEDARELIELLGRRRLLVVLGIDRLERTLVDIVARRR